MTGSEDPQIRASSRPNSRQALAVVCRENSSSETPRDFGQHGGRVDQIGRLVPLAAQADAAKDRGCRSRSGSDRPAPWRPRPAGASDFLNVTMPAKLIHSPSSTHSAAVSAVPVKECITPDSGPRAAGLAEHRQHVGVAFAGVDDERQAALLATAADAGRNNPAAHPAAHSPSGDRGPSRPGPTTRGSPARSTIAVPIARLGLGRVVGLDADGGQHAREFAGQLDALAGWSGPWCRRPRSASTPASRARANDFGPIGVEIFLIEMGVRVEQHRRT